MISRRRLLELLVCLPAPLCLLLVAGLVGRAVLYRDQIDAGYRAGARAAMEAADYEKARVFYSRLIDSNNSADPQDRLNWARILGQSGDPLAANAVLNELAPDDAVGYSLAHRQRALMLTAMTEQKPVTANPNSANPNSANPNTEGLNTEGTSSTDSDPASPEMTRPNPALLEQLHWHLKHGARDDSSEAHRLWASYFVKVGKLDEAVARMELAARREPNLWLTAARLAGATGDTTSMDRFLDRARQAAKDALDDHPHDVQQRLMLVQAMVQQGRLDESEQTLAEGLRATGDPMLRRASADLMLLKFDRATDTEMDERISFLANASTLDPNNPALYARMVTYYQSLSGDAEKASLRAALQRAIVKGNGTGFAHFALGSIFWLEEDLKQSLFHLEQAFELRPQMLDVANNLAWLLAKGPEPDLERAEKLIRSAIEKRPNDIRYRDTLATVLEEAQRWDEALLELERVLSATAGKKDSSLHKRLAKTYRALGNESLAKMHEEEADAE